MPNKNKVLLILCFFVFQAINTLAQEIGIIEFDEPTHDFGQIKEENGYAVHEFKFTNIGKGPLQIKDVKASCGCTTPSYSKEPIMPGKSGFIKAQFDPFNRSGVFDKTLTVETNSKPATTFLKIKGFVIARPRTIADDFPDTIGNLRLASRYMNLGSITTKGLVNAQFKVYNDGKNMISFQPPSKLPNHLKIEITPTTIAPKQEGVIKVIYDPALKNDFGYLFDNFTIQTNDKKSPIKELCVVAIVSEDFSNLSIEQKNNSPKINIPKNTIDLGDINSGTTKDLEFEIFNTGKTDLLVRKIKSTCSCIVIESNVSTIKSGSMGAFKAKFDTSGRKGKEFKTIYVYSNDYQNPETTINIKANILKP